MDRLRAFFAALTRLRGPARFAAISGVMVVIALGLYSLDRGRVWVEADPNFCRTCHTMEKAWEKWSTSEHRTVDCVNCHEQNILESTQLLVAYVVTRPDKVNKHAGISDGACLKCHGGGDPKWLQVADTAGHQVHADEQGIPCAKCHSVSLHRFEPPQKICLACHGEKAVKITKMAERYCLDCHQYLRDGSTLRPTRVVCLDCHEKQAKGGEIHWPTDAPMVFQCSRCHQPHQEAKPQTTCQTCHKSVAEQGLHSAPTHAAVASTSCITCHKPHEWQVEDRDTCLACHRDKVIHNQPILCATCHDFRGKRAVG